MNIIDLFSGGGGLTEGFLREGFNIVAHVEKDRWACETLKTRICYHSLLRKKDLDLYKSYLENAEDYRSIDKNRKIIFDKYPDLKEKLDREVLNYTFGNPDEDKEATSIEDIIKKIEESKKYNKAKNIDLIIGGPPCQAYSLVGRGVMKQKVDNDKRNYLFRYYKKIVNHFKPKAFVFENVPGMLTAKKGEIFDAIVQEFKEIGYTLLSGVNQNPVDNIINVSNMNIPQNRKRIILFGFQTDLKYKYPDILKYKYDFESNDTKAAIFDLPKLHSGEGKYGEKLDYSINDIKNLSEFQKLMRETSFGVFNHQARQHHERDLAIYKLAIEKISNGEIMRYTDIPQQYKTHKNENSFLDRFKVHWWNNTPHTILAHLSKDGHYNIHPDIDQCRSLTVREAARIQTFPDNYIFEGPRTAQYTQVGNAVPPLLAEAIAKAVKSLLRKKGNLYER